MKSGAMPVSCPHHSHRDDTHTPHDTNSQNGIQKSDDALHSDRAITTHSRQHNPDQTEQLATLTPLTVVVWFTFAPDANSVFTTSSRPFWLAIHSGVVPSSCHSSTHTSHITHHTSQTPTTGYIAEEKPDQFTDMSKLTHSPLLPGSLSRLTSTASSQRHHGRSDLRSTVVLYHRPATNNTRTLHHNTHQQPTQAACPSHSNHAISRHTTPYPEARNTHRHTMVHVRARRQQRPHNITTTVLTRDEQRCETIRLPTPQPQPSHTTPHAPIHIRRLRRTTQPIHSSHSPSPPGSRSRPTPKVTSQHHHGRSY